MDPPPQHRKSLLLHRSSIRRSKDKDAKEPRMTNTKPTQHEARDRAFAVSPLLAIPHMPVLHTTFSGTGALDADVPPFPAARPDISPGQMLADTYPRLLVLPAKKANYKAWADRHIVFTRFRQGAFLHVFRPLVNSGVEVERLTLWRNSIVCVDDDIPRPPATPYLLKLTGTPSFYNASAIMRSNANIPPDTKSSSVLYIGFATSKDLARWLNQVKSAVFEHPSIPSIPHHALFFHRLESSPSVPKATNSSSTPNSKYNANANANANANTISGTERFSRQSLTQYRPDIASYFHYHANASFTMPPNLPSRASTYSTFSDLDLPFQIGVDPSLSSRPSTARTLSYLGRPIGVDEASLYSFSQLSLASANTLNSRSRPHHLRLRATKSIEELDLPVPPDDDTYSQLSNSTHIRNSFSDPPPRRPATSPPALLDPNIDHLLFPLPPPVQPHAIDQIIESAARPSFSSCSSSSVYSSSRPSSSRPSSSRPSSSQHSSSRPSSSRPSSSRPSSSRPSSASAHGHGHHPQLNNITIQPMHPSSPIVIAPELSSSPPRSSSFQSPAHYHPLQPPTPHTVPSPHSPQSPYSPQSPQSPQSPSHQRILQAHRRSDFPSPSRPPPNCPLPPIPTMSSSPVSNLLSPDTPITPEPLSQDESDESAQAPGSFRTIRINNNVLTTPLNSPTSPTETETIAFNTNPHARPGAEDKPIEIEKRLTIQAALEWLDNPNSFA